MRHDDSSPVTLNRSSSAPTPKLFFGLLLIFIGLVFTFDQMGWIDADEVWQYWPVFLIAAGLSKLVWPGSTGSRLNGVVLVVVGTWLLFEILDIVYFSFWNYWPLLLVLIGVRIAWRGLGRDRPQVVESSSTVNAMAVMGGVTRTSNSADFRGGDMIAFMGGCDIDLRQAKIAQSPAVIDAFAFWGGVEIKVPEDWTVTVSGVPLLGGYEDSTRPPRQDAGLTRSELIVKGFAIMGGVEVKN